MTAISTREGYWESELQMEVSQSQTRCLVGTEQPGKGWQGSNWQNSGSLHAQLE